MRFIFYDFETTGRNYTWDQIIQVGAVVTNEKLEEIDNFESSCILKPGIVPEPAALLVNKRIPGEHTNLSHYNLVKLMWKKFNDWIEEYGPVAFFGYNSINFDEEFLRRTFYKNLFPPFLTSSNNYGMSNKRGDIINLARSTNYFYPGTLKTSFNEKGKEIFKLEQLASDNIISDQGNNLTFHDALDDTRATIGIAKIIKNKAPLLWDSGLKTMSKMEAHDFITDEEFVKQFFIDNPADALVNLYAVNPHVDTKDNSTNMFDITLDSLNLYLQVNLLSLFSVCREFARNNKAGSIINFSSTYGIVSPNPSLYREGKEKHVGYCVSKSGVVQLSRYLAVHLSPKFRINCVAPGGVAFTPTNEDSKRFIKLYEEKTPMKRMMNVNELNGIVEYLCSDKSSYTTGAVFNVDGGWTVW